MKLMIQNLESLGTEMFSITGRGGLLLMLIFFYSGMLVIPREFTVSKIYNLAFVFGAAYWIETGNDVPQDQIPNYCATLSSCVYTMVRLTLYDGYNTYFQYEIILMLFV